MTGLLISFFAQVHLWIIWATEPTKHAQTASRDNMALGGPFVGGALVLLDSHICYTSVRNVVALTERFASLGLD